MLYLFNALPFWLWHRVFTHTICVFIMFLSRQFLKKQNPKGLQPTTERPLSTTLTPTCYHHGFKANISETKAMLKSSCIISKKYCCYFLGFLKLWFLRFLMLVNGVFLLQNQNQRLVTIFHNNVLVLILQKNYYKFSVSSMDSIQLLLLPFLVTC